MDSSQCSAVVINAPEFFKDPAFRTWLNNGNPKFTWHKRRRRPSEWSDVVVLVDPGLSGEGSDSDMPEHIWSQIVAEVKRYHELSGGSWPLRTGHVMVRLTNLDAEG